MPYIYKAALYCDTCGREIQDALDGEGKTPTIPADETTFDSDEYPKHALMGGNIFAGDFPYHCDSGTECVEAVELPSGQKIGALLNEKLTLEGIEYVKEAIEAGGEVADFWEEEFADCLD